MLYWSVCFVSDIRWEPFSTFHDHMKVIHCIFYTPCFVLKVKLISTGLQHRICFEEQIVKRVVKS